MTPPAALADVSFRWSRYPEFGASFRPASIVTGDFNGDGIPDLVAVNPEDAFRSLNFFRFNSEGMFEGPVVTNLTGLTTQRPGPSTAADFDNDGKLDVAVAYTWAVAPSPGNAITIHLGDGQGQFIPAPVVTTGTQPAGVVAADFNSDGNVDLAVTACSSGVILHLGDGTGGFATGMQVTPGACNDGHALYANVLAADVNDDGALDIVANLSPLQVLLGDAQGAFTAHPPGIEASSLPVALADFDRDGTLDILVGGVNRTILAVVVGDGAGSFAGDYMTVSAGQSCDPFNCGPRRFVSAIPGDFDNDGDVDVAASRTDISFGESPLVIFRRDEANVHVPANLGSPFSSFATNDFNQDGRPDIVGAELTFSLFVNTSSRGCEAFLDLSYSPGTLTMQFTLKAGPVPVTWHTYLAYGTQFVNWWSIALPPFSTPATLDLPVQGFSSVGYIGVLTFLSTPQHGAICGDFEVLDTGGAALSHGR